MSESPVYVGMDVPNAPRDLSAPAAPRAQSRQFANTAVGHRGLVRWVRALGAVQVVCEATGGDERAALAALRAAGLAVSGVNAPQGGDFARAQGRLAKTDRLAAGGVGGVGWRLRPARSP